MTVKLFRYEQTFFFSHHSPRPGLRDKSYAMALENPVSVSRAFKIYELAAFVSFDICLNRKSGFSTRVLIRRSSHKDVSRGFSELQAPPT